MFNISFSYFFVCFEQQLNHFKRYFNIDVSLEKNSSGDSYIRIKTYDHENNLINDFYLYNKSQLIF